MSALSSAFFPTPETEFAVPDGPAASSHAYADAMQTAAGFPLSDLLVRGAGASDATTTPPIGGTAATSGLASWLGQVVEDNGAERIGLTHDIQHQASEHDHVLDAPKIRELNLRIGSLAVETDVELKTALSFNNCVSKLVSAN